MSHYDPPNTGIPPILSNPPAPKKAMRKVILYISKEDHISRLLEKFSAEDVEVIIVFNSTNQRLPNC